MNNIDTNILFNTVYTREDLLLFYKEIDQLITQLFKKTESFEQIMDSVISADKKEAVLYYLKQLKVKMDNPVEINDALAKISKIGNSLPVIYFELAFEPTEAIIKKMSFWFTKWYKTKVILNLSLERRILGGAYISYDGLYKDYTLLTKVDKFFSAKS